MGMVRFVNTGIIVLARMKFSLDIQKNIPVDFGKNNHLIQFLMVLASQPCS